MAMQKPLITTFIASIPEVVSGKVIFVPPGSSDAIAKALLAIKKNQSIFADTPTLSFHWDDTVSQLSKLYN
jgi:glycosyltransferase involved in cell wall biosynthesis